MKTLLRSFLSPSGRIGIIGYWWRQLLLALPLAPLLGHVGYHGRLMFGMSPTADALPALPLTLAQGCPPCLASALFGEVSGDFRFTREWETVHLYEYTPTGWEWGAGLGLILCLLAACLLSWCSAALVLRRLRDTRFGLWALPLCLCFFWGIGLTQLPRGCSWLAEVVIGILVLANIIVTSWPSRRGLPEQPES